MILLFFYFITENGTVLDVLPPPEATCLGTTGKIPDHSQCNGEVGK